MGCYVGWAVTTYKQEKKRTTRVCVNLCLTQEEKQKTMATPVLARRSVAWRSWCQGSKFCDTFGGWREQERKKGLFQNNCAPMNWTPISGQSLLGELLEHIFQLSFIQKESRSGSETTLWYERKHTKWGQLGDSHPKHTPDLNWNTGLGERCTASLVTGLSAAWL